MAEAADAGAIDRCPVRVLWICGLGSRTDGPKPEYVRKYFEHVSVPKIKHSDHAGTKEILTRAVREFRPDVVCGHSAGVGKAMSLATTGVWAGPLVLLAGGRGCAPVSDFLGRAVTLVIPTHDADAAAQRRALRSCVDKEMVVGVEVDDVQELNSSMLTSDRLRHLIVETVQRHERTDALDIDEDAAALCPATPAKDRIRWLFSEWTSGDGLSREEFKSFYSTISPGEPEREVEELVDVVDTSKDGVIDLDEFAQWVFSDGPSRIEEIMPHLEAAVPAAAAEALAHEAPTEDVVLVAGSTEEVPAEEVLADDDAHRAGGPDSHMAVAEGGDASAQTGLSTLASARPGSSPVAPGQLFTWGRGSDGQLGQDAVIYPHPNCALPHPVPSLHNVVHVACGGGQQGCTAAVTLAGELFTFGNNFKGRLGHGEGPAVREPRKVLALGREHVLAAACGPDHTAALVRGGGVFLWGGNREGQLGRGHTETRGPELAAPVQVALPEAVLQVDCEDRYSAAVLESGRLFTWGCGGHGRLGNGSSRSSSMPLEIRTSAAVSSVSLGSLYAGAVGSAGELLMWGYGGHGNLGLGSRASMNLPTAVDLGEPAVQVACTRGQEGCKGGLNPKSGGQEGPHTVVVGASGALYTMGTCHKGLLCNLGSKDGAFGKPWDELRPYRVGGVIRNRTDNPPISPLAVWPPPYDAIGPVTMAVSAHIHAACVGSDGKAWAWGCGSNDGRCGVERFLNMKGEGRPPEIDMMKCYMMGPHRIGLARRLYWKHRSLQSLRVLFLATGRNHMACIATPDDTDETSLHSA